MLLNTGNSHETDNVTTALYWLEYGSRQYVQQSDRARLLEQLLFLKRLSGSFETSEWFCKIFVGSYKKKQCQTSCGIWMWKWKRYQFLSTRRFRCLRPWCERRSCTENLRSWNENKQSALFRSWCVKRTSKCVAKFWGAHNLLRAFSPSCFDRWSNHCIFLKL